MILFAWLAFHKRNLTWENLMKRGWHGPNICSLCRSDGESNVHLFLKRKKTKQIWLALEKEYGFQHCSQGSIYEWILWCSGQKETLRRIFILSLWNIWKWRNFNIFKGSNSSCSEIIDRISANFDALPQKSTNQKKVVSELQSTKCSTFPLVFFDGAE